jgi:hypothetical protein
MRLVWVDRQVCVLQARIRWPARMYATNVGSAPANDVLVCCGVGSAKRA